MDLGASKLVEGAQAPFSAITVLRLIVPTRFLAKGHGLSGHEEYVLLVAVRRVDLQKDSQGMDYAASLWLVTASSGTATVQDAPQWLASRPNNNLAIVRGGRAYATLPLGAPGASCVQVVEVLAADGTWCGSISTGDAPGQCRTEDIGLALDGTPVQLVSKDLSIASSCSYRWWPQALR